jgi:DNA polymerase-4
MTAARKIIHIDMDCFYAAIEERENPELRGKPLAVAGCSRRGVLTTANYPARKFGCRSAMPVFKALELCPHLVVVPVRFDLYRAESTRIRAIFGRFTDLIEPLSLDEAYLDVSHLQSSGAAIAREIRHQIHEETRLTASAGVGPNKLVAKIASDWRKPNGQFEVKPEEVADFMAALPVGKLWGVGAKSRERLEAVGITTCGELRAMSKLEVSRRLGRWGLELHDLAWGRDEREVTPDRVRKSLSNESTFNQDLNDPAALEAAMAGMLDELEQDLAKHSARAIRALVVKMKFADFQRTTAERAAAALDRRAYQELLAEAFSRGAGKPVRLLGVGVRFAGDEPGAQMALL